MDTIVFGTPQKPSASITPFRSLVRITAPAVTGAPQSVPQSFETLLAAASMGVYR